MSARLNEHLSIVNRLMDHYRNGRTEQFVECFTDDLEYYFHMGSKPVIGKEKLRKFLRNYGGAYQQRVWRLDASASDGDLLLVEGYEELYDRQYDRIIEQPFMQAYEFRGDKIAKMRDYYEPARLRPPESAVQSGSGA